MGYVRALKSVSVPVAAGTGHIVVPAGAVISLDEMREDFRKRVEEGGERMDRLFEKASKGDHEEYEEVTSPARETADEEFERRSGDEETASAAPRKAKKSSGDGND
jgi:vacuolar-type H+-ATPase subunit H